MLDQRAAGRENGFELVRIHQSAPPGSQHLARVVVERSQRLGRWRLDVGDDTGAGPRMESDRDRVRLAVRAGDATLREDLLDARALAERRDLGLQRGELGDIGFDDGPDRDPDMVLVELAAGRAARGAYPTDRLETVLDRALGVGEAGDGAVVVAYDRELAYLRHRDQAPIAGVLPCHAFVQQNVGRRIESRDVELTQPPQVEPAPDHRMHPADQIVLGVLTGCVAPERVVADLAAASG